MDQVNCRLEIPNVEGLTPAEITVGRHVLLGCSGDWNKTFDLTKAQFKTDEAAKYVVKVLKAEARNANAFDLDMTLYVAGQFDFPELILTDGTNEINLGRQRFEVKSVLEAPAQGKPPQKPFGFLFPQQLQWPMLYFALMIGVVILFLVGLILKLRRAARFAKLIADLKNHNSAISPDLQFYKTLRMAEKKQYPLDELENAFRLYVLRVFEVPMFVLDNRQIQRFFKKRKLAFKLERLQVDRLLSEFEEIQKSKKEISSAEKLELVSKLYRFVDRTQGLVKAAGANS